MDYVNFVNSVMSDTSKDVNLLTDRIKDLSHRYPHVNFSQLLTAALGLPGETGEACDLVKKIILQGKEPTDDVLTKLKSEIGDILWYVAAICLALNVSFEDLMNNNKEKLLSRYSNGKFSVEQSENRKEK